LSGCDLWSKDRIHPGPFSKLFARCLIPVPPQSMIWKPRLPSPDCPCATWVHSTGGQPGDLSAGHERNQPPDEGRPQNRGLDGRFAPAGSGRYLCDCTGRNSFRYFQAAGGQKENGVGAGRAPIPGRVPMRTGSGKSRRFLGRHQTRPSSAWAHTGRKRTLGGCYGASVGCGTGHPRSRLLRDRRSDGGGARLAECVRRVQKSSLRPRPVVRDRAAAARELCFRRCV